MTTLREHLEHGNIEYVKKHFENLKGSIPMCCFEMKNVNGKIYVRCSWSKHWLILEEFREFCKNCQREIARRIGSEVNFQSQRKRDSNSEEVIS